MKADLDIITKKLTSNGDSYTPMFGTASWQNLLLDSFTFPGVLYDLPKVKFTLKQGGRVSKTYPLTVYIPYRSELDWTGEQHEEILIKTDRAMEEFIKRVENYRDANGNKLFESFEIVSDAERVKGHVFDVCTTGTIQQFNITPNVNTSICI